MKIEIKRIFHNVAAALVFSIASVSVAGANYLVVDPKDGLPMVSNGQKNIIETHYVYFGIEPSGKWTWAGQRNDFKIISDYNYEISGENQVFDYTYNGNVAKINDTSVRYEIEFETRKEIDPVIGGGIELVLDPSYNEIYGTPRLLDNSTGWIWGDENGEHFKMEFSEPVKYIFFERNDPNRIRIFFFLNEIEIAKLSHKATFSVPSDFKIRQTDDELFGLIDFDNWFEIDAPFYTATDLSHLNHIPAGKHGFLRTDGDSLFFADGTEAKFWGTSISAQALFATPYEEVADHARRISALGFNLVRLTHHDARWVQPNVFGIGKNTTNQISEDHMRIIDKWVAELNKKGVYIWFDFHHERLLKEGDGIDGFDEIARKTMNHPDRADLKGYSYFNESIQRTMLSLNKQLITRINSETYERYADNKGIVFLLLTNENDITHHFGNLLLRAQDVPFHTELMDEAVEEFADKYDLSETQVGRTWVPGPSKLFLNDAEHNFNQKMISGLREDDPNHLVVTTSLWGDNRMYSLPALTDSALIDVHSYGTVGELERNPNVSGNFLHRIASSHVLGKPLSVSEWAVATFPTPDRHMSPLYMAAVASHQGWDAMMHFNYATAVPSRTGNAYSFEMYHDPGMLGTMQAAALLFRTGHVQEALKTYVFAPSVEDLMYTDMRTENAKVLRTVPEKSKLLIKMPKMTSLPWLVSSSIPEDAEIITDRNFSLVDEGDNSATSDTKELHRNWAEGIYTINTSNSKAAMGWIGKQQIDLGDVVLDIKTRSASIAVQALDNTAINASDDIMISMAARAQPTFGRRRGPSLAEPVTGSVKIKGKPGLKLYKHRRGDSYRELDVSYNDGIYEIELEQDLGTYWLFLRP